MKTVRILMLAPLSLITLSAIAFAKPVALEFDQLDGSKIILKRQGENPEPRVTIETKLKEVKHVGTLRGPDSSRGEVVWTLIAGKQGYELSAESHIFAFPSDSSRGKATHFSYP